MPPSRAELVDQELISDASCHRGTFPGADVVKRYWRVVYADRWPPIGTELCHPGNAPDDPDRASSARIIGHNFITKAMPLPLTADVTHACSTPVSSTAPTQGRASATAGAPWERARCGR